jgi:hypothetical protein
VAINVKHSKNFKSETSISKKKNVRMVRKKASQREFARNFLESKTLTALGSSCTENLAELVTFIIHRSQYSFSYYDPTT